MTVFEFRSMLEAMGMTLRQFGDVTGVPYRTLQRWVHTDAEMPSLAAFAIRAMWRDYQTQHKGTDHV